MKDEILSEEPITLDWGKSVNIETANKAALKLFGTLIAMTEVHLQKPDRRKHALVGSVKAIKSFLQIFPAVRDNRAYLPLSHLLHAMTDLEQGISPALFEPAKSGKGGRNPDANRTVNLQVFALVASKQIVAEGASVSEADGLVAKVLDKSGVKPDRGRAKNISTRTIRTWRMRASGDEKALETALGREMHRVGKLIERHSPQGGTKQQRIDFVLRKLGTTVKALLREEI